MSLFTIDISPLLASPVGTTEEFTFEQDIPEDTFVDFVCLETLVMNIKLVRQEYGIQCLLLELSTKVDIPEEYITDRDIRISNVSREFHEKERKEDSDDIEYIDDHDGTIDLSTVIAQEILIAGL